MHKRAMGGAEEVHAEGAQFYFFVLDDIIDDDSSCSWYWMTSSWMTSSCSCHHAFKLFCSSKPNVSGEGSLSCKSLLLKDLEAVCGPQVYVWYVVCVYRPQVLLLRNKICMDMSQDVCVEQCRESSGGADCHQTAPHIFPTGV